ncbi:hypothetical protein E4U41_001369 [Claviceps citrina]|nr:hypothetical protein E4U41_001369 [Claviceps citrina]
MSSPLLPVREASLNRSTPPSKRKYDQYEVCAVTASATTAAAAASVSGSESSRSSPFVSKIEDETADLGQENMSKSKARHSRVISGTGLSPLKILAEQRNISPGSRPAGSLDMGPPPQPPPQPQPPTTTTTTTSPRKLFSPTSRFPVKVAGPRDGDARLAKERKLSIEDVVRGNDGLERAIDIFEDDASGLGELGEVLNVETRHEQDHQQDQYDEHKPEHDDAAGADESMISTFSTFSVVPNLTVFANLGQSPAKHSAMEAMTPRAKPPLLQHDFSAGRPSSSGSHGNTSNLLMDFTEQMRFPQKSPGRRGRLSPSRTMPADVAVAATPNRPAASLIDFDIPPMPTPRSLPSITPRELESLKSGFLSEISSLKASLSGKEAEVQSLKAAVGDAETRVGESLERLREERALKEQLAAEREDWEKRGRDMEGVMRKMREEMMTSQRDRDELEQKLEESEKRREAAEMLHQEAESKMAGMRAGKNCGLDKPGKDAPSSSSSSSSPSSPSSPEKAKAASNKEVEMAVERVARELHALYKGKHETKVAALKKSYEARWEKRVKELESRIEELGTENETLRDRAIGSSKSNENMTRPDPDTTVAEERVAQAAKDGAAIRELNANVERLEAIVSTVERDNRELRSMLEKERVEKGELVQLAEEMMSMQAMGGSAAGAELQPPAATRHHDRLERGPAEMGGAKTPRAAVAAPGDLARNPSVGRSGGSGLRPPGSVVRPPGHMRRGSGGLPRPGAGAGPGLGPGRSGIMSSIEKMGNYRGRGRGQE